MWAVLERDRQQTKKAGKIPAFFVCCRFETLFKYEHCGSLIDMADELFTISAETNGRNISEDFAVSFGHILLFQLQSWRS